MTFMLAALLMMTVAAIIARGRVADALDGAQLGTVSPQWLAEYRASHPA